MLINNKMGMQYGSTTICIVPSLFIQNTTENREEDNPLKDERGMRVVIVIVVVVIIDMQSFQFRE